MKTRGATLLLLLWSSVLTAAVPCSNYAVLSKLSTLIGEQKAELQHAKAQMAAMETRLKASENQMKNLQKCNEERKVAFAVSLETDTNRYTGPISTGQTLVHKLVITNVGKAYNSNTGFFTAPVKGVYDFQFHVYGGGGPTGIGAFLRKNRSHIVMAYTGGSGSINASNGVSLLLEAGDTVDIYLPAKLRILDNRSHHSTFKGHLLFQV